MNNIEQIKKWIKQRKDVNPKEGQKKYGDVTFADDRNKKYPIDTEGHIRAAWSYIHMPKNAAEYNAGDVESIKAKIVQAWESVIGGKPELAKADYLPQGFNEAEVEQRMEIYEMYMFTDLLRDIAQLIANQKKEELSEGESIAIRELLEQAQSFILQASHLDSFENKDNDPNGEVKIVSEKVGDNENDVFGKCEKCGTEKRDDVVGQDIFKDPKKIEKEDEEGAGDVDVGVEEGGDYEGSDSIDTEGGEDMAMSDSDIEMAKSIIAMIRKGLAKKVKIKER